MLIGMGVVFSFLLLLMGYMKIVPILSRLRSERKSEIKPKQSSPEATNTKQKLKLNSVLTQISSKDKDGPTELEIAAIAAAIFSHTGKKPKKLVITTPTGKTESINLWGVSGRQDIMQAQDVTGQVGFQY